MFGQYMLHQMTVSMSFMIWWGVVGEVSCFLVYLGTPQQASDFSLTPGDRGCDISRGLNGL